MAAMNSIVTTSATLSAYERARLERIQRNEQMMRQVGLGVKNEAFVRGDVRRRTGGRSAADANTTTTTTTRLIRSPHATWRAADEVHVRRSARLMKRPRVAYIEPELTLAESAAANTTYTNTNRIYTNRINTNNTKPEMNSHTDSRADSMVELSRAVRGEAKTREVVCVSDSCRVLDADVAGMQRSYLARSVPLVPGYGGAFKASVMARLRDASVPRMPRFSKYSGVQEWRNCVALFVNVGAGVGEYENVFYARAERMAWFAQQSHSMETPVVKRLMREGEEVLLFIRRGAGEGYVFCGRLEVSDVAEDERPIKIVWRLRDYKALIASEDFTELVGLRHDDDEAKAIVGDGEGDKTDATTTMRSPA